MTTTSHQPDPTSVLEFRQASLSYGARALWGGLDLRIQPGEFLAVLGPNGAGKTSMLRTILGQQPLTSGSLDFLGAPVRRGDRRIGYIPQQRLMEAGTPLRARDLIALGISGHRWGLHPLGSADRARLEEILEHVGATAFADAPVANLSGGEQQRVRVGQAIAAAPALMLCDEPLISLDLRHQRVITDLIDAERRERAAAVVFVTHDVNPILDAVDRVLYVAGGRFLIGTPDQVLRADVLSDLYGTAVDVVRTMGRVLIVGAAETHDPGHAAPGAERAA